MPDRFGPDLPAIREWTEAHYQFAGYVIYRFQGQLKVFHISPGVGDRRVLSGGPAPRQHSLGNINAQDVSRSLLSRPAAEPAEAAAKVQDFEPAQVRKQSTERRSFLSTVQALD